ncbi:MAG: hypothetical protein JWN50_755 [Parcubacteria group bacterium]|nr:hypothetical protein [Parcubacteria group bacterium]
MKTSPNTETTLRDLLIQKLQALSDIEHELVKALPDMAEAASNPSLKKGFRDHLDETRNHVCRIEDAFALMNEKPKKLKVEAIRGLVKDAKWVMKNVKGTETLDANLIAAARYVEHYEMAGYMGALEWARTLGETKVASLLRATLAEEKKADKTLEKAGTIINKKAV